MRTDIARRTLVATLVVVAVAAIAAGGWLFASSQVDHAAAAGSLTKAAPGGKVVVSPANHATGVSPDTPVTVDTQNGRLSAVLVVGPDGAGLQGTPSPDGSAWALAPGQLGYGTTYQVKVTLDTTRGLVTRTSTFSTLTPTNRLSAYVTPGDGDTVGVGMPITVRFKGNVANRAAAEAHLHVTSTPAVVGAWHWFSPSEVHFRPMSYWPAGTKVAVVADLAGVDLGNGAWGDRDVAVHFNIGDAHVSTVNIAAHTMTVTNNGAVVQQFPMSAGSDKFPTMGGVHIALDKAQDVLMDSATWGIPRNSPDGYYEHVYYDVRISNGGEYVHAAPWSVGAQGNTNVSHGCVNLSPANATWFFNFALRGDVVNVINSPRPVDPSDAGTRDWNMSWAQWIAGSALPASPVG